MLTWTKVLPNTDGWYWFRADEASRKRHGNTMIPVFRQDAEPTIVKVWHDKMRNSFIARFPSRNLDVIAMGGEWAGPISLPQSKPALEPFGALHE